MNTKTCGKADLKSKEDVIDPNHPQRDMRCDVCERSISELRPHDKKMLPLEWRFKPIYLKMTYRPAAPALGRKAQELWDLLFGEHETPDNNARGNDVSSEEYREEDIQEMREIKYFSNYYDEVWECCDCIVLPEREYFTKLGWDLDEHYAWVPQKRKESRK